MKFGWRGAFGIVLSAAFLYFAFRGIEFDRVMANVRHANIALLVLSAITATAIFPLRARRWRPILEPIEPDIPMSRLIRPVVVLDFSAECAADPDFLLEVDHVRGWEAEHGPLPDGGWMIYRTGWDARSDSQERFINADETGPHTPGMSIECARWVAEEAPVVGVGVETVGTDAGAAHSFDPPFPCHSYLMGSGKYGLTQLQNVALLPATGAVLVVGPLPIVTGSGSPARAVALVER